MGRCGNTVWSAPLRVLEHRYDPVSRIDAAIDTVLPGEPVHPVAIESASVEIGIAAILGQLPHIDRFGNRVIAKDRVLAAFGDVVLAVRALNHALRGRSFTPRK